MSIERPWTAVAAPARGGFAVAAAGSLLAHAGLLAALIAAAPAAPHGGEPFVVEAEIVEAPSLRAEGAEPPAPLAFDMAALPPTEATPEPPAPTETPPPEPAREPIAALTDDAPEPRETAQQAHEPAGEPPQDPAPAAAATADAADAGAPPTPSPASAEIALAPPSPETATAPAFALPAAAPPPEPVPATPAAAPPVAATEPPVPSAAAFAPRRPTPRKAERTPRKPEPGRHAPESTQRARDKARPREAAPRRLAALPAAPAAPAAPAGRAAAPAAAPAASGADVSAWRAQVAARIAAMKRYPAGARERGDAGRPVVAFSLTRAGGLAGVSLARASGHADLDAETLAMVRRAAPFPKPPPGAPLSFSLAVSFALR